MSAADVFWLIMTFIDAAVAIAYGALAKSGWHGRIGPDRRRKLRRSAWLAFAWMGVCAAHFALNLPR